MAPDLTNQEAFPSHLLSWFKLGVAVAIIKNKPAQVSLKRFTEQLCIQFTMSLLELRNKYQVHVNRPSTLCQCQGKVQGNLSLKEKNQCQFSQTYDVLHNGGSCKLTPPSSGSGFLDCPYNFCDSSQREKNFPADLFSGILNRCPESSAQSQFTKAVQDLASIFSGSIETHSEMVSMIETCVRSLNTMSTVIQQRELYVSPSCLCEGARAVVSVLNKYPRLEEQDQVMEKLCSLIEHVMAALKDGFSRNLSCRQQQLFNEMVTVFLCSKDFPLLPSILESLVDEVDTYCSSLYQSTKSLTPINPDFYDNGYFILQSLEKAFQIWTQRTQLESQVSLDLLQQIQAKLDSMALLLIHSFPLVARFIWRITSLLEHLIQQVISVGN